MKKVLVLFGIILILMAGCTGTGEASQTSETPISHTLTPALDEIISPEPTAASAPTSLPMPTISPPDQPAIILFIGDGMGSEHRIGGQYYSVGEVRLLTMDKLPVRGWLETAPLDSDSPESASSATAMATGSKTNTGEISLDVEGNELKTILEYAQDLGMSTGLVSTKYISDATTAAFTAHVENYAWIDEISPQIIEHRVNVIFGGGEDHFLPLGVSGCYPETGTRTDGRNLIQEAIEAGYTWICTAQEFEQLDPQTNPLVLGLFADKNMERPYSPSLADMTRKAIEILSENPNGYFLVVEGAQIDTASHYNETMNVLEDVVGLDEAVAVGMEFAKEDNTLIIVTADHETGGMHVTIEPSGNADEVGPLQMPNGTDFYVSWTTGNHTDVNVPVTAYGIGSEKFSGLHPNTIVFDVIAEVLGIPAGN